MNETRRKRRYFCSACGEELTVDHMDHTTAVSPCKNPSCLSRLPRSYSTPPPTNQRLEVAIKRLDHHRDRLQEAERNIQKLKLTTGAINTARHAADRRIEEQENKILQLEHIIQKHFLQHPPKQSGPVESRSNLTELIPGKLCYFYDSRDGERTPGFFKGKNGKYFTDHRGSHWENIQTIPPEDIL